MSSSFFSPIFPRLLKLMQTMETRPVVPDRKLLARLVLIREEARNMMGGGMLDERNDRGFNTLPESEVSMLAFIGLISIISAYPAVIIFLNSLFLCFKNIIDYFCSS